MFTPQTSTQFQQESKNENDNRQKCKAIFFLSPKQIINQHTDRGEGPGGKTKEIKIAKDKLTKRERERKEGKERP
jgi:hypothetical protein